MHSSRAGGVAVPGSSYHQSKPPSRHAGLLPRTPKDTTVHAKAESYNSAGALTRCASLPPISRYWLLVPSSQVSSSSTPPRDSNCVHKQTPIHQQLETASFIPIEPVIADSGASYARPIQAYCIDIDAWPLRSRSALL
jgi:hypothetical protein